MARPVMLGNGSLTVGLNEQGLVHDFYYPYVGLENLTTSRSLHHKIGIWVNQTFSWIDDGSWEITVDFDNDALISNIRMISKTLQIEIVTQDFVDSEFNVFARCLKITNHATVQREIRLFMHQVFQISIGGRADTALYEPEEKYLLDYKGKCSLLIYGETDEGKVFDQYAVGNYAIEGKEGTYKDAEDGELSGSAVEHGGVDSVIGFVLSVDTEKSVKINYWIVAADSQFNAERLHLYIKEHGLEYRLKNTRKYWHDWMTQADDSLAIIEHKYKQPVKKSLLLIKAHTDKRGGIIASCDSSIYNYGRDYYSYVWPRDGAFVIWPLIRMGFKDEAKKFFNFCRDIMTPDGYLMHKYQPDRAIGSTWHPLVHGNHKELAIQEDETAIVIFMLGEYMAKTKDEHFVRNMYTTFIQPVANFMRTFIDSETNLPHASYDLWEEKFLTNTYTTLLVHKALRVAADFAEKFEYPDDAHTWQSTADNIIEHCDVLYNKQKNSYIKGFLMEEDKTLSMDNTLDVSSLYGVMMFGERQNKDDRLLNTMSSIESTLLDISPSGGSPRYENDNYFASAPAHMGNPWFVTTLWLAQFYAHAGQTDKAKHYIDWTIKHTLESGVLSEQINPNDGSPLSVAPLVWSHAELINTILDVSKNNEKYERNIT